MRGIFVGLPDDSAGWLLYLPSIKKTYISLDVTFDENFIITLSVLDIPYQGVLRIRYTELDNTKSALLIEKAGSPLGSEA